MPSPFPGMDPFLEHPAFWPDFHARFVNYWCEAIADLLPMDYEASINERVYLVEHDPDARKLGSPVVAVSQGTSGRASPARASMGAATLEPVTIPLAILEGPKETYIEILHQPEGSLVTTLELLSPANKEQNRGDFLAKRKALIHQNVNIVELDLLRQGHRLPMQKPLPAVDYFYLVSRAESRPDSQVFSWSLRQPLPSLPVPLRSPDADLIIDLGAVFTTAYDRGHFDRRLPYGRDLPAHLQDDESQWIGEVIESHLRGEA